MVAYAETNWQQSVEDILRDVGDIIERQQAEIRRLQARATQLEAEISLLRAFGSEGFRRIQTSLDDLAFFLPPESRRTVRRLNGEARHSMGVVEL